MKAKLVKENLNENLSKFSKDIKGFITIVTDDEFNTLANFWNKFLPEYGIEKMEYRTGYFNPPGIDVNLTLPEPANDIIHIADQLKKSIFIKNIDDIKFKVFVIDNRGVHSWIWTSEGDFIEKI